MVKPNISLETQIETLCCDIGYAENVFHILNLLTNILTVIEDGWSGSNSAWKEVSIKQRAMYKRLLSGRGCVNTQRLFCTLLLYSTHLVKCRKTRTLQPMIGFPPFSWSLWDSTAAFNVFFILQRRLSWNVSWLSFRVDIWKDYVRIWCGTCDCGYGQLTHLFLLKKMNQNHNNL